MATYNKFDVTVKNVNEGKHNFATDVLKAVLTNTAPVATNAVLTDITQIAASGGYTAGGRTLTFTSSAQTSGVYRLIVQGTTWTASGSMGPFRYVVVYDDTPTSPADPLICWFDYGSAQTLTTAGDQFVFTPDQSLGLFSDT